MTQLITWPYILRQGHTNDPSEGACAMDAVNWFAHGLHGDQPACASPVISAFVIVGNDAMPDDVRQRLLAYLPRIAGSRSPAHEARRAKILVVAAFRVFASGALDAAGLPDEAAALRIIADQLDHGLSYGAAGAAARAAWAAGAAARAAWAAGVAATAAGAAARAARAAKAAEAAEVWEDYFSVLDAVLEAGPQGEPWSADALDAATTRYSAAGGKLETV